jgi:PAS domain S-box-containing protein
MADMSSDAFYLTDARGRFLYVNDQATRVGGYPQAEILQMSVSDINPEFPPARFRGSTALMTSTISLAARICSRVALEKAMAGRWP